MGTFLARYADLLSRETNNDIRLDGRRLGFIYRNIIATRSVELAKAKMNGTDPQPVAESARYTIQASIPVGVNEDHAVRDESLHKIDICFDLLKDCLENNGNSDKVELVYELFTSDDLIRKTEILITEKLGELVASKALNDLLKRGEDVTLFAYTALQVEAHRPGTVPQELLESLSSCIDSSNLGPECIPGLKDMAIECVDDIEKLLDRDSDMEKLLSIQRVKTLNAQKIITPNDIAETKELIERDIETFQKLMTEGRQ